MKPDNAYIGNKFLGGNTMKKKAETVISTFRTVVAMCARETWACGTWAGGHGLGGHGLAFAT